MLLRSLALVLAVSALAWSQDGAGPTPMTIRILTYNVHHGEGFDGEFDLARQARVIASASPDLVALQEVDEATERSSGVRQVAELGRLTGMHAVFGEAMAFQGGKYGVGVLSRWPIASSQNHPLPGGPNREPRTALSVVVRAEPRQPPITFTSTHLDFGRNVGRDAQAQALNDMLTGSDDALSILGGDMNSADDSEVLRILRERWTEIVVPGVTALSAGRPGYRLDYLLIRPAARWRVVEARLVDGPPASDHIPVLAVLELVGPR
jgi:endonuclease/exonuclease/phosphatase family metal-dependent hydrolase